MSLALCNFFTHAILQTIQKIPLNVMTLEIVTKRVYTAKVNPDFASLPAHMLTWQ